MFKNKKIYISHSVELLVWLIIILFATAFFSLRHIRNEKLLNDYNIFLQDVDGLIVGSPVRMMGIEVGHITKIKPTNDEVFVKFIINDNNIKLPQGTVATVEFSGMAGSKSLELYLPDENTYIDKDVPLINVLPPKRLHDAAGLLNEMFKKISSIIYTSSNFAGKLGQMDIPAPNVNGNTDFLKYYNEIIDNANEKVNEFDKNLEKYKMEREAHGVH